MHRLSTRRRHSAAELERSSHLRRPSDADARQRSKFDGLRMGDIPQAPVVLKQLVREIEPAASRGAASKHDGKELDRR
jgi:hypothetical protein